MGSDYIITSNGNFIGEDELRHYGVLGMKWGIRRYQNPDGTLTAAGKKRYTNSDGSLNKAGKKKFGNSVKTENEVAKKKSVKDMTDEELDRAIIRARKEDEYNRLRPEPKEEVKDSNYKKMASKLVNEMVVPALITSGRSALQKVMDKQVNELLKDKIDPNSKEALQKAYDKLKLQKDIEKLKKGTASMDELTKAYALRKQLMTDAKLDDGEKAEEARKLLKELGWNDGINKSKSNGVTEAEDNKTTKTDDKQKTKLDEKEAKQKELDDLLAKGSKNYKSELDSKAYKKKVDKILSEMDNKAWDTYNSTYAKQQTKTSEKAAKQNAKELDKLLSKAKSSDSDDYDHEIYGSKAYEAMVDHILANLDKRGWDIYYSEYANKS